MNDDGMRLRVKAMLKYMNISEMPQPNKGRIHINKAELIEEVKKNGGKISFDTAGYTKFKDEETTANKFPDVPQRVRPRFRPAKPGEGPPGTFIREGGDDEPPLPAYKHEDSIEPRQEAAPRHSDSYQQERRESRRSPYPGDDRGPRGSWQQAEKRGSYAVRNAPEQDFENRRGPERRGQYNDDAPRGYAYGREREPNSRGFGDHHDPDRASHTSNAYGDHDRRGRQPDMTDRRGGHRDWDGGGSYERDRRSSQYERDRYDERGEDRRSFQRPSHRDSYYGEEKHSPRDIDQGRGFSRDHDMNDRRPSQRDMKMSDRPGDRGFESARPSGPDFSDGRSGQPFERTAKRQRHSLDQFGEPVGYDGPRQKRVSDSALYVNKRGGSISSEAIKPFGTIKEDPDPFGAEPGDIPEHDRRKRSFDEDQKPATNRGYNIEPSYAKRKSF